MARILVVDDNELVAQTIEHALRRDHQVWVAHNGIEALKMANQVNPDLIVLDIVMPGMSGLEVCRELRRDPLLKSIPILFLTGLARVEDKIVGFEAGTDDYLTKPCDNRELVLRVNAILRWAKVEPPVVKPSQIKLGALTLDCQAYEVDTGDRRVLLTPIEFGLLYHLMTHPGEVFSSERLLNEVWDYPSDTGSPDLVRIHIRNLRHKIEPDSRNPQYLVTVSRQGYTIPEVESADTIVPLQKEITQLQKETTQLQQEIRQMRLERLRLLRRIETLEEEKLPSELAPISLEKLGRLAGGIAHDVRGGLGVIRNIAGLALDDVNELDPLAADLRKIVHSTEFCEVAIRNLMALGWVEDFKPTQVNVEEVVREAFLILERKLIDVTLVVDVDPDTPPIIADKGHMKQVFVNLIRNAGEAMPSGGTLTFRARHQGKMLRVELSDTGCGISVQDQERLFHDFFSTKDRGYGLGLHIAKSIVESHGGAIEVESKVGEGTTLILHLPVE